MGAAKHYATRLDPVPDDATPTVAAFRRERMNRALKTIEIVRDAVHEDFDRLVVLVAAALTLLDSGVKLIFRLARQFRFQHSRRVLLVLSLNHDSNIAAPRTPPYQASPFQITVEVLSQRLGISAAGVRD
jgi:hypothetical protein